MDMTNFWPAFGMVTVSQGWRPGIGSLDLIPFQAHQRQVPRHCPRVQRRGDGLRQLSWRFFRDLGTSSRPPAIHCRAADLRHGGRASLSALF
ncbi:MAG: hypothetical protein MZU95_05885 [Desulfomicrobium escambiense]|nr:hypothetical protein [Desulfomicrobium escambiense]